MTKKLKTRIVLFFIRCDQQRIEYNTQSECLMVEFSFDG